MLNHEAFITLVCNNLPVSYLLFLEAMKPQHDVCLVLLVPLLMASVFANVYVLLISPPSLLL